MIQAGIYIILNKVNNKSYIGSSVNLIKRKREHISNLNRGTHHSKYLQASYNKYGRKSFLYKVLEYCETSYLLEKEQYYIDTLKPVYNMSKTAKNVLGIKRSKETIEKLSKSHKGQIAWNKGIPATQKQKDNQSNKMKGRVSGSKGFKWSKESKEKLSNSKINKPLSDTHKLNLSKKINEYTINGVFIKQYNSLTEAAKSVNSLHNNLSRAMKQNKQFKNKIFKYEN